MSSRLEMKNPSLIQLRIALSLPVSLSGNILLIPTVFLAPYYILPIEYLRKSSYIFLNRKSFIPKKTALNNLHFLQSYTGNETVLIDYCWQYIETVNDHLKSINLKLNVALNCWTQDSLKPALDIHRNPKFASYKASVLISKYINDEILSTHHTIVQ